MAVNLYSIKNWLVLVLHQAWGSLVLSCWSCCFSLKTGCFCAICSSKTVMSARRGLCQPRSSEMGWKILNSLIRVRGSVVKHSKPVFEACVRISKSRLYGVVGTDSTCRNGWNWCLRGSCSTISSKKKPSTARESDGWDPPWHDGRIQSTWIQALRIHTKQNIKLPPLHQQHHVQHR